MDILDTIAAGTVESGEVISHPEINEGEPVIVKEITFDTGSMVTVTWRDFNWQDNDGYTPLNYDEAVNYHGV